MTMSKSYRVGTMPGRPPSVNHLYTRGAHGRRVLSKEGERYKKQAVDALAHAWVFEEPFNPTSIYHVIIEVAFPRDAIFTKGKKAKHPVKQMDASNLTKIVEDALALAMGVDDRYFFQITTRKVVANAESEEGVTVYVREHERVG